MQCRPIGIIANPASGKDIRRIAALGSVFSNVEKVNIIKRILAALTAFGIDDVYLMPDDSGLARRAIEDIGAEKTAKLLDMQVSGNQDDSARAAEMMDQLGAACIITLGGDGTNRVVVRSCGQTPILPISTGTNNVFPIFIEGTLAGIAAAVLASGEFLPEDVCRRHSVLEIIQDGKVIDVALIDLVVTDYDYIGARAVFDIEAIKEVIITQSRPSNIGFSAIGGYLSPLPLPSGKGMHIRLGSGGLVVKAPIAPGLIREIPIANFRVIEPDDEIEISGSPFVLALDGEREISLRDGDSVSVRLIAKGPLIVDVEKLMERSSKEGFFLTRSY